MGKTVALVVSLMVSVFLLASLAAVRGKYRREIDSLRKTVTDQDSELGRLRADTSYLKSQTTEIDILESELESKRKELGILRRKGEEQQELMLEMEEQLTEFTDMQDELDRLTVENEMLAEKLASFEAAQVGTEYEYLDESKPFDLEDTIGEEAAAGLDETDRVEDLTFSEEETETALSLQ